MVLDTSAYSNLRRGDENVHRYLGAATQTLVPMIVLGELEAGFEVGSRTRANRMLLQEFLREPWVSVLPISRSVTYHYAHTFARLRSAGTPIPTNDIWIAATTIDAGAHLLTFDSDYGAISTLSCTILSN